LKIGRLSEKLIEHRERL